MTTIEDELDVQITANSKDAGEAERPEETQPEGIRTTDDVAEPEMQPQSLAIPEPMSEQKPAGMIDPKMMQLAQFAGALAPLVQAIAPMFQPQRDPRQERLANIMDELMVRSFIRDLNSVSRVRGISTDTLDQAAKEKVEE